MTLQFQSWLIERKIRKLVVVLTSVDTKEVLERWEFKVEYEEEADGSKENVDVNVSSKKNFKNVSDKVCQFLTSRCSSNF